MDIVFRYFVVVAAAMSIINLLAAERQLRSSGINAAPDQVALLLVNAIVFAALLAGFWGPIPRPKF